MSLLVVMAHFDVARILRDHTLRTIENYAAAADRVVVISTSGIRPEDHERLPAKVEFVTRPNFGYDFFSYKWGLDLVGDYGAYDRVVISNDTFIGPVLPLATILESDRAHECDIMGMTWSENHGGHAQSFFVTVSGRAARANAFQHFWRDMTPISDRTKVILSYEVGMTTAITDSGFTAGGYLVPTEQEEQLARERFRHMYSVRLKANGGTTVRGVHPSWTEDHYRSYNPAIALSDRLLMYARLPLLKFDTLRFDPYGLGARDLLDAVEKAYPVETQGVRAFLRETRADYPFRPGEHNILPDPAALAESGLGYCMDAGFLTQEPKNDGVS